MNPPLSKRWHRRTRTVSIAEILLKKYKDGLSAEERRERDECVNENKEQFYKSKVSQATHIEAMKES